jgi:uncharacterized protein (DUF952 family)
MPKARAQIPAAMDVAPVKHATIYKIMSAHAWSDAQKTGTYSGSDDDRRDGFIHFSAAHQLSGTAAKHFKGQQDLVLVAIDAAALGAALRWEPSRGGDLFPHLYGTLPVAAAQWFRPLPVGDDGVPVIPRDVLPC